MPIAEQCVGVHHYWIDADPLRYCRYCGQFTMWVPGYGRSTLPAAWIIVSLNTP